MASETGRLLYVHVKHCTAVKARSRKALHASMYIPHSTFTAVLGFFQYNTHVHFSKVLRLLLLMDDIE